MLNDEQSRLTKGVQNLLFNCGGCKTGDTILIVFETEHDGYYDPELAQTVMQLANEMGLKPINFGVPFARDVTDPDDKLSILMAEADCTVFFARLGDQIRFRSKDASMNQIISYALDRKMLSSPFGTVPYTAFERLKHMINDAVSSAQDIHVTCPAGTNFRGTVTEKLHLDGDVTRKRFPVSVFTPVPAGTFKGTIAQCGFLTGTGSNYYEPYSCALEDTLLINFESNQITGFDGTNADVEAARTHYEFVGKKFGIDTFHVHSWHIGIHPGCHYSKLATESFERWSGGAFGNPRLLHFHTCGAYPPGEISLNVLDSTVRLDDLVLWQDGRLNPSLLKGGNALLDEQPGMRALFDNPSPAAGQGPDNKLSFP